MSLALFLLVLLAISALATSPPYSNTSQAPVASVGPDQEVVLRSLETAVAGMDEQSLWLVGQNGFVYVPVIAEVGNVVVVSTTMDIDSARILVQGMLVRFMDGNSAYLFSRGSYDPARPSEAFHSLPRSAREADRILGEDIAYEGAAQWMSTPDLRLYRNEPLEMLAPDVIQSLRIRMEQYTQTVRALASYFRLTAHFQFPTNHPTLTLLSIPQPLYVQEYAVREVWQRIWGWQGMI